MNAMLSDEELTALLAETAAAYPVPELDLDLPQPRRTAWWQRRGWQVTGAAAAVVAATVLLQTTLTGPGGSSTTALKKQVGTTARAPQALVPEVTGGQVGAGGGERAPVAGPVPVGGAQVGALVGAPAGAGAGSTGDVAAPLADGARVVKTGTITLSVDHGKVSATLDRLGPLVKGYGGYVSDSTSEEAGDHPSATVTIRVPVARFEDLVGRVRVLAKVVSWQTSGKDVTGVYADTQAQIESLRAARARFLAILAGAKTIGETLTVQQRVDDVQGQIDQLEAQRRVLASQSDLATLTVSVGEKGDEVLATPARTGWSKAWHDAVHGFTGGVQGLLAASGTALLVLLVGAVLLLLGRLGWRRARRRLV